MSPSSSWPCACRTCCCWPGFDLARRFGDKAPRVELLELYTERIPCPVCADWLNQAPFTEASVFYTVEARNALDNLTKAQTLMNSLLDAAR